MAVFRKHQREIDEIARKIIDGISPLRSITLDCTPGGGKTGAATLFANKLLDAGLIDRVLWLVPRLSLAEQVLDAFSRGAGCNSSRQLEIADPQDDLFSPTLPNTPHVVGCVTTYQAVAHGRNWSRFADGLRSGRGLIIFDEVQFLNDEAQRGWYAKVGRVKDAAEYCLFMSGTLWRTDDKRIPFIEYEKRDDGKHYPLCDISYTLRDAVRERAVLPTEWRNLGGMVEYKLADKVQTHDLMDDGDDEESRKVLTFLSGEKTVGRLLDNMVDDWRVWCKTAYESRMLVMASSIAEARRWKHYLEEKHSIPCVLATSKEEAAGRKLRHFRERRHGQCLVTVAMAYVGFDCPDLTHLAYLSATRAPSWLLQSFARVSRFDRNAPIGYERQHSFVYAPDDLRMRVFMAWLRNQQEMGITERQVRGPLKEPRKPGYPPDDEFEPLDAAPGFTAMESLHARIEPAKLSRLMQFASSCPAAAGLPLSQLDEILLGAGVDLTREVTG